MLNGAVAVALIFGVDYVGMDNISQRAKEIVDLLYERARLNKNYIVTPSHPIISEKYSNDYFEYLIDCIKRTVKEENALLRQIMYTVLSACGNDPINLGVLAPTSTGKTYPIIETAKFTPLGKEVRIVGSMTPIVLIREHGVLVDRQGNPISKEVRRLKNAISSSKSTLDILSNSDYHSVSALCSLIGFGSLFPLGSTAEIIFSSIAANLSLIQSVP